MRDQRAALIALAVGSVLLLALLAYAISSSDDDLGGTDWQMTSLVVDGSMTPAIDGLAVTISFKDTTVEGFGGCNTYFGDYTSDDGSLSLGPLGSTMAICDAGISDQEFVYLSHLSAVDGFRIERDQLILSDGATDLIMFDPANG